MPSGQLRPSYLSHETENHIGGLGRAPLLPAALTQDTQAMGA